MGELVKLFKEDILKGVQVLLLTARRQEGAHDGKTQISIAMLLLLSALFALIRTMYGTAEYGITQHFVSTFTILLAVYIIAGTLILAFSRISLQRINAYAATVFACLLIAGLFYFLSIFLFGFFTGPLLDAIDGALPTSIRDTAVVINIERAVPALMFSIFGCCLVLFFNRNTYRKIAVPFSIYLLCTTGIFYLTVFDRGHFFDRVMRLIGNITL